MTDRQTPETVRQIATPSVRQVDRQIRVSLGAHTHTYKRKERKVKPRKTKERQMKG